MGYVVDTILAVAGSLFATACIDLFRLYPKIPNIMFLPLLVVLALAVTRGRYAAILASFISVITFDYFLVPPIYLFTVSNQDEWFALFIFLVTAVITGQLASAYKRRAELASQRENETRVLYEMLRATATTMKLEQQLSVVARALVDNFAFAGVQDCAILLPDEHGKLQLCADPLQSAEQTPVLSADEEKTLATVITQGKVIDVHADPDSTTDHLAPHWFRRSVTGEGSEREYVRLIPLQLGSRNIGVVRLLMTQTSSKHVSFERSQSLERDRTNGRTTFFWTFLDQATVIIERARLRREALDVELLRRTDALRSALISSVSHDLRTPLSSIKAAASSLLQEDVQWSEDERRSFALAIEREADRLNRLVGNLLDMSRIEGGALKPEKEWYPIDELIHDVLGHMQFLLHDREVKTDIAEDLPPVELDYLQIDQVLTNLLENAARYTALASPIEVSARVKGHSMLVQIADHGPGIPTKDLERIFDKFYRVSRTSSGNSGVRGSGLGLAVCRGLVEAHGGQIWAENRPEGGAIFQFTLPLGEAKREQI
ncbi:MAG TPA: ATP-binding protein [Ktedonobacteraceae bacterium]|nr:ATP-binding protein [Ktedonobacteraceae bacterium]